MTKVALDIVYGEEEWDTAYIDGVKVLEDHGLSHRVVLTALDGRPFVVRYGMVKASWLDDNGRLPPQLADIPMTSGSSTYSKTAMSTNTHTNNRVGKAPIQYIPDFVRNPAEVFARLRDELAWIRHSDAPRAEYYVNDHGVPYTYGRGAGVRTYQPQPTHRAIDTIRANLEMLTLSVLDVCFLNRYDTSRDQLGWHADDSPEMDDFRPIGVVSLGAAREMWVRPQGADKGKIPSGLDGVERFMLAPGSLFLMPPGMQDTWYHRIPKASAPCGPRISLTFRGYVTP